MTLSIDGHGSWCWHLDGGGTAKEMSTPQYNRPLWVSTAGLVEARHSYHVTVTAGAEGGTAQGVLARLYVADAARVGFEGGQLLKTLRFPVSTTTVQQSSNQPALAAVGGCFRADSRHSVELLVSDLYLFSQILPLEHLRELPGMLQLYAAEPADDGENTRNSDRAHEL